MTIDGNIKITCICFIFVINSLPTRPTRQEVPHDGDIQDLNDDGPYPNTNDQAKKSDCWMNFDVSNHCITIDKIDRKYAKARREFHDKVAKQLNSNMLKMMASRAIHNSTEGDLKILADTKLGGNCIIRRPDSILFFFGMKLRDDTVFRMNFFENDIMNMSLRADVGLNDFHLVGMYERSAIHLNPSVLFYSESAGVVEVLLHDVRYKMLGNLRLQGNGFVVESIVSELVHNDNMVPMTFIDRNVSVKMQLIDRSSLDDFEERLKTDLDRWIKYYLNDYLTYFQLNEVEKQFYNYEKSKVKEYNNFSDYVIKQIKNRIDTIGFHEVTLPHFTFFSMTHMKIQLTKGVVRGFDTIYKRSVATGRRQNDKYIVDMIVAFSNLKVEYQITVVKPNEQSITGHLHLSADDVSAHLQVTVVRDPDTVDLAFKYVEQLKPESLAVIGEAKQLLSEYKRLLETEIIAIMTNGLKHNLKMLGTLTRCQPFLSSFNKRSKAHNNFEKRVGRRFL